jgi:DNA replication protein DnaC
MMELSVLLERLKMEHLLPQLDGVCEQAAKSDLDYQGFLARALEAEWRGRQQRGIDMRLRMARFPWLKTLEQFDFDCQVLATAILDRLLHHATTLNIKGESYRLREKKKAGLFGQRLPSELLEVTPDAPS